jgi:hypothetical protein
VTAAPFAAFTWLGALRTKDVTCVLYIDRTQERCLR